MAGDLEAGKAPESKLHVSVGVVGALGFGTRGPGFVINHASFRSDFATCRPISQHVAAATQSLGGEGFGYDAEGTSVDRLISAGGAAELLLHTCGEGLAAMSDPNPSPA